jgi:hypothetical protein
MNKRARVFFDLFIPMKNGDNTQTAVGYEKRSEPYKIEEQPTTTTSLEEQVKDWAITEGYLQHDKKEAWDTIKARIESKAEPYISETPVEIPASVPELESAKLKRQRLEEIKKKIQPRLDSANEQSRNLERMGVTLLGTRLMIWFGWLCVTALGWVFSWMLERIVKKAQQAQGQTEYSINDIIALIVASFALLRKKIIAAFPGYVDYEWFAIILGIGFVVAAIIAYLQAQRISGQFQSIENAINLAAQGETTPEIDKETGTYRYNRRLSRKKSKWLILAVGLGLIGFGILLSAIEQSYNTISMIMLGYSLAVVTAAVMILVVHYTLRRADDNSKNQHYLPDWLFKTLVGVTLGLLVMLLVSLVLIAGVASDFPSALAIFSIGVFLLLGTAVLAVGQIQHNVFKNELYWIGVRGQLDGRLHDLQEEIEKPIIEAKKVQKEQEDRKRKAAEEKVKIQRELDRMRIVFEEAYNRGRNTRELQEKRISLLPSQGEQSIMA